MSKRLTSPRLILPPSPKFQNPAKEKKTSLLVKIHISQKESNEILSEKNFSYIKTPRKHIPIAIFN